MTVTSYISVGDFSCNDLNPSITVTKNQPNVLTYTSVHAEQLSYKHITFFAMLDGVVLHQIVKIPMISTYMCVFHGGHRTINYMYLTLLPVLCCEMSVIFLDECEMFEVSSVLPSRGNVILSAV